MFFSRLRVSAQALMVREEGGTLVGTEYTVCFVASAELGGADGAGDLCLFLGK